MEVRKEFDALNLGNFMYVVYVYLYGKAAQLAVFVSG